MIIVKLKKSREKAQKRATYHTHKVKDMKELQSLLEEYKPRFRRKDYKVVTILFDVE